MAWRDTIAGLVEIADTKAVLSFFDELDRDRVQTRQRAEAYLAEIVALKGGKSVSRPSTEDVLNRLTAEIRRYTDSR